MRRLSAILMTLTLAFTMSALIASTASAQCGSGAGDYAKSSDIVDTAAAAGTFGTLLAAAEAAGMVDALKQQGPLTVFAPTDAAFAKLPKGTVEALLKDTKKLKAILSFHVVAGKVDSRAAAKAGKAASLLGSSPRFEVRSFFPGIRP